MILTTTFNDEYLHIHFAMVAIPNIPSQLSCLIPCFSDITSLQAHDMNYLTRIVTFIYPSQMAE